MQEPYIKSTVIFHIHSMLLTISVLWYLVVGSYISHHDWINMGTVFLRSIAYIRNYSWCYQVLWIFDICIMSCIHHYSIIQNSFPSLKYPMFCLFTPSPLSSNFCKLVIFFTITCFSLSGKGIHNSCLWCKYFCFKG